MRHLHATPSAARCRAIDVNIPTLPHASEFADLDLRMRLKLAVDEEPVLCIAPDIMTCNELHCCLSYWAKPCVKLSYQPPPMTATLKPCRRSPALGLPGTPDSLLAGVDIQTFWSTHIIYLSASDPTQLGMPEFPEAFWCYVAKPIDWDRLQDILARLFPHQPPRQGTPGSGGEATPHLHRSRSAWTTQEVLK
jgi:hypothetical protein